MKGLFAINRRCCVLDIVQHKLKRIMSDSTVDGRIYLNSESGIFGNSTPDNYDILSDGLEAFGQEEQ